MKTGRVILPEKDQENNATRHHKAFLTNAYFVLLS